jgi:hypothetical protein
MKQIDKRSHPSPSSYSIAYLASAFAKNIGTTLEKYILTASFI